MRIRNATALDIERIRGVHFSAFPKDEREAVSKLACDLLLEKSDQRIVSLVAEVEDYVIGHIALSPVTFDSDKKSLGYILAPLAVSPDHQNLRVGTSLVEYGIRKLTEIGTCILLVYGDPQYYKRFGFQRDVAEGLIPPYELQYPLGWQAMIINGIRADVPPGRIACVASLRHPELW